MKINWIKGCSFFFCFNFRIWGFEYKYRWGELNLRRWKKIYTENLSELRFFFSFFQSFLFFIKCIIVLKFKEFTKKENKLVYIVHKNKSTYLRLIESILFTSGNTKKIFVRESFFLVYIQIKVHKIKSSNIVWIKRYIAILYLYIGWYHLRTKVVLFTSGNTNKFLLKNEKTFWKTFKRRSIKTSQPTYVNNVAYGNTKKSSIAKLVDLF